MVKKIETILVPLDGSKNSVRGLDQAISLARQNQSTITGLFVKSIPAVYVLHPIVFLGKGIDKAAKKILESAKIRAAKRGIMFKGVSKRGADPGFDIVQYAHDKKNKIDMIVIGARGMGFAREVLLGSISNYVIHKSKMPVLLVK